MPPQLVLEIKRFKISKDVWSTSKSRRIVAFAEGSYHGKIVKSVDSKVYTGTKLCLPWNETLQKLQINFYFIDDLLTIDIGTALYAISEDGKFGQETASTEVTLKIYPVGAVVPVGRALVSIQVQDMFDDENTGAHKCAVPKQTVIDHDFAVPGFRFKRLSRVLHWERIRSMNLSQTVQNADVRTLLTCLDDVTCGDASQEDIDPQLYKALQMAQYGSQYLLSCRKVMKDREAVLKAALKAFQQEEVVLDLKLAKLRARDKALHREARDLDDLTVEYSSALKEVNPRLINTLYKTYQEKVRIPSTGQLVEMADHRQLNQEDEYDRNSSDDNYRHRSSRRGEGNRRHGYQRSVDRSGKQRPAEWEEAPPVSEQMNLQPREPHVFDLNTALGPRRTLRHPQVGSSRQIGDPWASTDSRDAPRGSKFPGKDKNEGADWARRRHEEDFETENAYYNASNENVSNTAQPSTAGWKTSTVAAAREIPTGHTVPASLPSRTVIDRSQQQGWVDDGVRSVSDDENSGSESDSRRKEGDIKRVVSRSEFASSVTQPVLRTLSVRSINVNADSVPTAARPAEKSSANDRNTPYMSGPRPSASINVARDGWSGAPLHNNTERQLASTARPAQPPAVMQSTGDMSAATAMSVDSLNPRMTQVHTPNMQDRIAARDNSRSSERFHHHDRSYEESGTKEMEADFSRNNESYENIDMSSFVQPSNNNSLSYTGERDVRGISQRDESSVSIEDYIASDLREAEREQQLHHQRLLQEQDQQNSLQRTLNSTNDSVMVEEFDDSLHMDHRPISGFTSSDPDPLSAKQQVRVSGSATPGRAPLLPPSASKSTPKRPERDEVFSPGEYEYSMSHDSPFPDLSGGKHFHHQQGRNNQSHISSNASNSRNYHDRSGMSHHTGGSDSYELDAFEDEEDDPFGGRASSGPKRTLDLTNITGGSTDIDASKSITIDFVLPSESKDLHRHASVRASEGAKSQHGGRSYPYEEPDISGELDLFSPLGGPQGNAGRFGSTLGAGPRGALRDDDDDVLMGTTKLSSGTRDFGNFSNTFQSRGTASDRFEQDSLGGTFTSNPSTTGNKATTFSPMTAPAGGAEEEEEEESIPPPTYDSMIGTGNTEDSNVSRSQLQQSQDEVSSYFEVSADAPSAHAPHHLHMHAVQTEAEAAGTVAPTWKLGRAPVDAIELATAFDVFVSAVQLDSQHARIYSEIQIKVEFLGIMSPLSSVVDLSRTQSVQPVSFSAHLLFSPEQEELLQQEIAELDDAIACQIHVLDAVTQEIVGTANVQLWVMVEDSVNILRQEVEVLNLDMSSEMGSALVDVKGFRLLKKCANAQRQRRTGH